jgi:hypothetical protein
MAYRDEIVLMAGRLWYTTPDGNDGASSLAQNWQGAVNEAILTGTTTGWGVLTNGRFIFGAGRKLKKLKVNAPVVIALCDDVYFDIPLFSIRNVAQGKQGLSPAIVIGTDQGAGKFSALRKSECDQWQAAVEKALAGERAQMLPDDPGKSNRIRCGGVFEFGIGKLIMNSYTPGNEDPPNRRINISREKAMKMWLIGLFGTLGFHYFAAGRMLPGFFNLLWGAIWWIIIVLFALDAEMSQFPALIGMFAVLMLVPSVISIVMIAIGKFRDVFGNYLISDKEMEAGKS